MSVIASTDLTNQGDDVLFDRKTLEKLQKVDIEDLDYDEGSDDDEMGIEDDIVIKGKRVKRVDDRAEDEQKSDDDDISDVDAQRIEKMADEIDQLYEQKKEYTMEKDRRTAKKEKKKSALLEQQRLKKDDIAEEEMLNNEDLVEDELNEASKNRKVRFNQDEGESDDEDEEDDDNGVFLNPLLVKSNKDKVKKEQKQKESEEEWSSDDEDQDGKKGKKDKKDSVLGKRKKRNGKDLNDFFGNKEIEIVPQEKMEDEGYSSLDSDDIAETRALAKLMLRKKTRTEILDSTYNRFATFEDKNQLPKWFVEEEEKHYRPNLPVTKEMVAEEKRQLKEYNERPSKKVMEAKHRKKRRLAKAMNKVKQKAQIIAEQDINEGSKMKQIQKLYKKEKAKLKEEKKYVVNKNFSSVSGRIKPPRNTKLVDRRMRKDLKLQKAKAKKTKKIGKSKNKAQMNKKR